MITVTPHPKWVDDLLDSLKQYHEKIVANQIFVAVTRGCLTKPLSQGATVDFYPLIESFPQYLGLTLAKVPAGNGEWSTKTRDWLISNIHQEKLHARWWRRMAIKFGVSETELDSSRLPPAEIDSINNYLWRICTHGSLTEAVAAANLAVEGVTGEWTKRVREGFKRFPRVEDTPLDNHALEWITAHASYDDKHPAEALEIIKAYATTESQQEKVKDAAIRALEYYSIALEACYRIHTTNN